MISRVGFGCASLMRLPSSRRRRNLIDAAIGAGLTHFDIAPMYGLGAAEGELGRALRGGRRDQVTIATKFGLDAPALLRWVGRWQGPARAVMARSSATREAVRGQRDLFVTPRVYEVAKARDSLDSSLRKLSVDHVDILFLHDPRPQDELDPGLQAFLEEAKAAGKIRAWGMSLDNPAGIDVIPRLANSGIVQLRHDVLANIKTGPRSIAFGVMSAHPRIAAFLSGAPEARRRWVATLGADPLEHDLLAKLLLSHTLEQDGVMASLYSTTHPPRLAVPAAVLHSEISREQRSGFAGCLAADRDKILSFSAR
jgi:hypothetical protein